MTGEIIMVRTATGPVPGKECPECKRQLPLESCFRKDKKRGTFSRRCKQCLDGKTKKDKARLMQSSMATNLLGSDRRNRIGER